MGIEVILRIFSADGLRKIFALARQKTGDRSANALRMLAMEKRYVNTIDAVILFLQGANPTLALQIASEDYLPEASRFEQLASLEELFGAMGMQDKAKHLATLYLEDLADLIVECVDPEFGFSRYAERMGRSAYYFDDLHTALKQAPSYIDNILFDIAEEYLSSVKPRLLLISIPFPGNLFAAFRLAQYTRKKYPEVKIAMGGGFVNTELRSLSDARVFDFFHFVSLDDGELPVEEICRNIDNPGYGKYKRTFILQNGEVEYVNNSEQRDYKQSEVGTPDYSGLKLNKYISVIEVANPMHRMWSDGRWNKLTMAHGCYWGKCTFCDISLDYIKVYEPVAASLLCDRMETLIQSTGQTGFHFVDEAAPPALMKALAIEILRRNLSVTWWTNIRFEKSFTPDLCRLLRASGCVAVSGGLEVASDRLLKLIDKGVTVGQVARVTNNFTRSGIMVHAYLMYGYPTQTEQETIDSLEMVRQLFEQGTLQSGFWHQFAMTAHSPVGLAPERFGVEPISPVGTFANNDVEFRDQTGIDHSKFSFGLKKSLYNFMHGMCFDFPLQEWFDFKIPATTIPGNFIRKELQIAESGEKPTSRLVFIGNPPLKSGYRVQKKGKTFEGAALTFHDNRSEIQVRVNDDQALWLEKILNDALPEVKSILSLKEARRLYEEMVGDDFDYFWISKAMNQIREAGLLLV